MENVRISSGRVVNMLTAAGVTANGNGAAVYKDSPYSTFQATVTGTGAVAATVDIEATNQVDANGAPTNWCETSLGTITLSGTTSSTDGFTTTAPWKWVRAVVSNISGTGATVICSMGV
jgi:hypothetical protein